MNRKSPKGSFRTWQMAVPALIGIAWLSVLGENYAEFFPAWTIFIPNFLAKVGVGIPTLYYGARILTHQRTHELDTRAQQIERGHAQIIAIGVIVGCALISF